VDFEQCATAHFTRYWRATPRRRQLTAGRYHELPSWFRVLEFQRERTWRYTTVGMSEGESDGIEAFLIVRDQNLRAVELLYALAHFHRTGAPLNLGHTVNFGTALWDGSNLDHGFLSFPYVDANGFDSFECDGRKTHVTWVIPITASERNYKKTDGVEALETLFEEHGLDYLNPARPSVV
jgi:Suppressor of fused protein (SUFU)